jgi:hypothetical protein
MSISDDRNCIEFFFRNRGGLGNGYTIYIGKPEGRR